MFHFISKKDWVIFFCFTLLLTSCNAKKKTTTFSSGYDTSGDAARGTTDNENDSDSDDNSANDNDDDSSVVASNSNSSDEVMTSSSTSTSTSSTSTTSSSSSSSATSSCSTAYYDSGPGAFNPRGTQLYQVQVNGCGTYRVAYYQYANGAWSGAAAFSDSFGLSVQPFVAVTELPAPNYVMQYVFMLGTNGHVYLAMYDSRSGWSVHDLSYPLSSNGYTSYTMTSLSYAKIGSYGGRPVVGVVGGSALGSKGFLYSEYWGWAFTSGYSSYGF